MNRGLNFVIIFSLILISCKVSGGNSDYTLERKNKFLRVVDILKSNNLDSIRRYVINGLPSDTINYISNIEAARRIITSSYGSQLIDSIIQIDSSFYSSNSIYTYRLNFYNAQNDFVGSVDMSFLSNDTQRVGNLNAIENINDTTTLRW